MSVETRPTLKGYFNTTDVPTEAQFANLIDSAVLLADFEANVQSILNAADYAAIKALLDLEIGTDVQAYDADTAKLDTAQTWAAAGQTVTEYDIGTVAAAATVTLAFANGNAQKAVVNGACTFTAPSTGMGSMMIAVTMGASAGTITTSGFTIVRGDTITYTEGDKFEFYVSRSTVGTSLSVGAMQ